MTAHRETLWFFAVAAGAYVALRWFAQCFATTGAFDSEPAQIALPPDAWVRGDAWAWAWWALAFGVHLAITLLRARSCEPRGNR